MNDKITLMDGTVLDCFPKLVADETVSGDLSIDTTGQYFIVPGTKAPTHLPKDVHEQRQKDHTLFYEHIHLFLAHADRILSDSRLFLAPVTVHNGLAYTGTSGLRHPTLGIYIEWWLHHKEASLDAKGRPIWYIAGSPLSGRNHCECVDRKNKRHLADLNGSFSAVWRTFMDVNNRYNEAKAKYMAFSLEEAIEILKGEDTADHRFKLFLRMERARYLNYISKLTKSLENSNEYINTLSHELRLVLVQLHKDAVTEFYHKALNLRSVTSLADQLFHETRIELRKELRSGRMTNLDYQHQLGVVKIRWQEAIREQKNYEDQTLEEIFGDNAWRFKFEDIEQLLIELKLIEQKENK